MKKQFYFILLISIFLFIEKVNCRNSKWLKYLYDKSREKRNKNCSKSHFHDYKNKNKVFPKNYLRDYNKTDECNKRCRRHKKDEVKHHPYERRHQNNKYDKYKNFPYEKKWGKNKGKKWKRGRRNNKRKIISKIVLFILLLAIVLGLKKLCKKCKQKKLSPMVMKYLNSPYPKNIPFTPINPSLQNSNDLNSPMIEFNNIQNSNNINTNNNSNISYINPYIPSRKL